MSVFRAASLSEIARRAKVSTGLFAHYFGDKDGLLEATLRFMAASLTRATAEGLRKAVTRRDRLFAVSDAALSDDQFESRTSAVWLAFWGQLTHSERYKRVQRIYQRRMTANLRHGLKGMIAPDCVPAYATMIAAMIDGLWLRSHIGDGAIGSDGASARALVRSFIDGLLAAPTAGIEAEPVRPLPLLLPEPPPEPLLFVSPVTASATPASPPPATPRSAVGYRMPGSASRNGPGCIRPSAPRCSGDAPRHSGGMAPRWPMARAWRPAGRCGSRVAPTSPVPSLRWSAQPGSRRALLHPGSNSRAVGNAGPVTVPPDSSRRISRGAVASSNCANPRRGSRRATR